MGRVDAAQPDDDDAAPDAKVKRPSITLDVRVDVQQAVAIEESNMLALVDGRPARMQRLGLLPISA